MWWLQINGRGCCCLVRYVDWYPQIFLLSGSALIDI